MVARNQLLAAPPYPVEQALTRLGHNLRTARIRRKYTIEEVAENIERVARGAGETEATSGEILGSAQALSEVSIHLRDEVEKFLHSVRAA